MGTLAMLSQHDLVRGEIGLHLENQFGYQNCDKFVKLYAKLSICPFLTV